MTPVYEERSGGTAMKILVTGGAGYIGSHTVYQLNKAGYDVVVLDNLSTGSRDALLGNEVFVEGDLADTGLLDRLFKHHKFESVIHFAASVKVDESVRKPEAYYQNNVSNSINLIRACIVHGVEDFVFSSSAAVYGNPADPYVSEDVPVGPINPYGWTKWMVEQILNDVSATHRFRHVSLRYFNAAGADPKARMGQSIGSHLVKVCAEAGVGVRPQVEVFGTDYPTSDGTGVRDFIHVVDLAVAHLDALAYLRNDGAPLPLNVGYGQGASVFEVIAMTQTISGTPFPVVHRGRRDGDSAALVARADRIKEVLGWKPKLASLNTIVGDALRWERELKKRRAA